jgi:hypothetical protein
MPAMPPALSNWTLLVAGAPLAHRLALGALGAALLLRGAQLVWLSLAAPGVLAGLLLASALTSSSPLFIQLAAGIALAGLGGWVAHRLEKVALRVAGALAGGVIIAAIGEIQAPPWPAWAGLLGALAGAMVLPRLAGLAIKITTPILGAIALVAATAPPPSWHLPTIIVLAGVGAVRQLSN